MTNIFPARICVADGMNFPVRMIRQLDLDVFLTTAKWTKH